MFMRIESTWNATEEVLLKADFRNAEFLAKFITEAGVINKRSINVIVTKEEQPVLLQTADIFGTILTNKLIHNMNLPTGRQSMVIVFYAESIFGFLVVSGIKPENFTDECIGFERIYTMVFAWSDSPNNGEDINDESDEESLFGFLDITGLEPVYFTEHVQSVWSRIYEICDGVESPYYEILIQKNDGHDWMTFEIFECGFKSNQNALCDEDDATENELPNGLGMMYQEYVCKVLLSTKGRRTGAGSAPPSLKGDELLKGFFLEVMKKFETAIGVLRKEKITIDPEDPAAVAQYAKVMKTVREKADLFSESQRIKYTIETRTKDIPDARPYLLALKDIRVKRGLVDEIGAEALMMDALDKVEKELKKPLLRNDKKGMALLMAEFDKINQRLGIRKEDLPKYEQQLELKMAKAQLEELKKDAVEAQKHGDTLHFWACLDMDPRNPLKQDFWSFCDTVNAGHCQFVISETLEQLYDIKHYLSLHVESFRLALILDELCCQVGISWHSPNESHLRGACWSFQSFLNASRLF